MEDAASGGKSSSDFEARGRQAEKVPSRSRKGLDCNLQALIRISTILQSGKRDLHLPNLLQEKSQREKGEGKKSLPLGGDNTKKKKKKNQDDPSAEGKNTHGH